MFRDRTEGYLEFGVLTYFCYHIKGTDEVITVAMLRPRTRWDLHKSRSLLTIF